MLFLMACYVFAIFYLVKMFVLYRESRFDNRVSEAKEIYESLQKEKGEVLEEKTHLEREVSEIFTLYEMTKEITQRLKKEEAFAIFRNKLKENVDMEDCRFLAFDSDENEEIRGSPEYFLFPLKSKRDNMGYVACKNLSGKEKDKVQILGHQFTLALRRVELHEEIEELAITDSLTGVHTRRHFLERFEEELKRSASRKIDLSLLMADVDYFKSFNDKFGHLVGDQILHEIGRIIKENIREIDFAGRYGGEEFCIVLPVTDRYGANFAAERLRAGVEEATIKAYDTTVKITMSIGISTFPADGKTLMELLDKADWALYRAKKKGRNCICAFGVYE